MLGFDAGDWWVREGESHLCHDFSNATPPGPVSQPAADNMAQAPGVLSLRGVGQSVMVMV